MDQRGQGMEGEEKIAHFPEATIFTHLSLKPLLLKANFNNGSTQKPLLDDHIKHQNHPSANSL